MTIDATLICLLAGPVIAGLVSLFKKAEIVARYPKAVAFILSVVIAVVSGMSLGHLDWPSIAQCVLVPFAGAVASYEVVKSATVEGA